MHRWDTSQPFVRSNEVIAGRVLRVKTLTGHGEGDCGFKVVLEGTAVVVATAELIDNVVTTEVVTGDVVVPCGAEVAAACVAVVLVEK